METIVVGVDGSGGSRAALEWAFDEAVRRNASVKAVGIWQYPYIAMAPSALGGVIAPVADMQSASEAALESVLADIAVPAGITLTKVVREGSASHVLLEESEGCSMLVLGSRGHGGFAGLVLGSVATQCVNHARVPTVIVPKH